MIPVYMDRQNDFSGGEVVEDAERRDDNIARISARTLRNWRLLNAGGFEERPGRRALLSAGGRVEDIIPDTDITHSLALPAGTVRIYDVTGAIVLERGGMPWSTESARNVIWTYFNRRIFLTFPGMRPQVIEWQGSGWQWIGNFTFYEEDRGRRMEPFWRYAPIGVTMWYEKNGSSLKAGQPITLNTSAPVFNANHVGVRVLYAGQQVEVTEVLSSTRARAIIKQELPRVRDYTVQDTSGFNVGDVVMGIDNDATGVVLKILGDVTMRMIITKNFGTGFQDEMIVGPSARTKVKGGGVWWDTGPNTEVTIWEESLMSSARGWPQSVSNDLNRLMFCDISYGPGADIAVWSAIGSHNDFLVGPEAASAIAEIVPGKRRVLFMVGAMGDQFVFTDGGIHVIPISTSNPLKPGSVEFRAVSAVGSARVQPVVASDAVVYVAAGGRHVESIIATGQNTRPYVTRNVSQFHNHLFNYPIALGILSAGALYIEEYVYAANSDGTVAIGKASPDKEWVGWVPWDGEGEVFWVAGSGSRLTLTTSYKGTYLAELLTEDYPLDAVVYPSSVPAQIAAGAPQGQGPLWLWNGTVEAYRGDRPLGPRTVANGALVPIDGEDLSTPDVFIGYGWTAIFRPFVHNTKSGQSVQQTMRRRKVKKMAVAFRNSTGFAVEGRRVAMYRAGEDHAMAPTKRDGVEFFKPRGRAHVPIVTLVKDTPGSLLIEEVGLEASV